MWIYLEETNNEWVECELLHEFIDAYQIRYYISEDSVEAVVKRESVREVINERRLDS